MCCLRGVPPPPSHLCVHSHPWQQLARGSNYPGRYRGQGRLVRRGGTRGTCVDEGLPASRLDGSVGALTPGTCTFVAYVCCHVCCHVCCQVVVAQYTLQNRAVHSAIQQALAANAVVEYDPHEGLFRLAGTVHSSLGACRPPATASHAACRPPLQCHSGVGRGGWVWMGGCLLTTSHALTRCRGARLFVCLLSCRLL